jgi:glycosyltransferase involved in cell wall biosynthesis
MKNKVLIVHDLVHPYRGPLFEKLSEHFDLTLAYRQKVGETPNVPLVRLRSFKLRNFVFYLGLIRLMRTNDVVILPLDLHYPQFFLYSFVFRKKVMWFGHATGLSRIAYYVRLLFIKYCAGVFVYYNTARAKLMRDGINPSRIFTTYNTIHVEHPTPPSQQRHYFLYVGRLQSNKKLIIACNAVDQLRDLFREKKITFRIVGDGIGQDLRDFVRSKNLEDIIVFYDGTYTEDQLAYHFGAALAYLSPGPVGLGVLHSFAYGVPVITARNEIHGPEFENVRCFRNALLYEQGVESLVDCLRFVVLHPYVSNFLGEHGYRLYVEERTMNNMVASVRGGIDYALSCQYCRS